MPAARSPAHPPPPQDPRGLWVYATSDGVGSGREIARLVELHAAYRWLCGGVAVAYHRLNDFRSDHGDVFSELVTQLLALCPARSQPTHGRRLIDVAVNAGLPSRAGR